MSEEAIRGRAGIQVWVCPEIAAHWDAERERAGPVSHPGCVGILGAFDDLAVGESVTRSLRCLPVDLALIMRKIKAFDCHRGTSGARATQCGAVMGDLLVLGRSGIAGPCRCFTGARIRRGVDGAAGTSADMHDAGIRIRPRPAGDRWSG